MRSAGRLCVAALLVLAGCSAPHEEKPIGSTLDILGPTHTFIEQLSSNALPSDWIVGGKPTAQNLSIVTVERLPAVLATPGAKSFTLLRRTRASLLATPYLSWNWMASPTNRETHPVRLVVGFANSRTPGERRTSWFPGSEELPDDIDKLAMIVWSETMLKRGSAKMLAVEKGQAEAFEYVVRGGNENAGKWWLDSVDLARLFHAAWPAADAGGVEVRLVGIAAAPSPEPATMHIANIRLSR